MTTHNGPTNLFADIPDQLPAELVQPLLTARNARIERIVSHGHASPADFWYDQQESEFVVLISGAARLRFEDRVINLKAGDCMNIRAGERHRVEWTAKDEPTIWLAVFYETDSGEIGE